MFCDLVGSTGLAAKLDAEDWRNLVNAYLEAASTAVTELGGHVLKKLGDGLMALFGYPQAQENDAERAVRAALAIQRALEDISVKNRGRGVPELLVRIGLESGPVVVETTGEVFGDAPNVAARVQAAARPGSVLVTMNVQRQVAGLFVAEDQGARELKGVSDAVQLFRIIRASGGGRRGGARALTPFVGREEELGVLARRWERARAGEGQVALIVGEPGLGKSRLIDEFHARLGETPHTWVEWSSSQLLQNTPLHPIAEWGRQRFGGDAPPERRIADLEGTLRLIGLDPVEHAPLLAPLVDIPLPPGRAPNLAPEELRRRQLAAMTAWVLAGARSQPAVVVFEDLHWADPTSLDLLRALAERGSQAPVFLLATTRPEFRPSWSLRSHHSVVSLSPLDRAGVARIVNEISARHALSKEVVDGVSERTGGVPLFVEEVTRLLLERGEQGGVQAIPPTLQQSLAARLDRLGPAREVAQIGAVLGRQFAYPLLRDIAETDEPALQSSLERLAEVDLLFVEGMPPQANYRFKHALIQDAAYDSLLKSRRQALHRRAAEILRNIAERAAAEPEVIAHHFTQAGLDDLAIEWWGRAGDQALRRSAFQEAIAPLRKAIELADRRGGVSPRATSGAVSAAERLKLQTGYGRAVMFSRGMSSDEAKAAFIRARELADRAGGVDERFETYHGLCVTSLMRGEEGAAHEIAETFRREAETCGALTEAAVGERILGLTCSLHGDFTAAKAHFEEALRIYDPERDRETRFRFGMDTRFGATVGLGSVTLMLGDIERARKLIDESVARAVESNHVPELFNAYSSNTALEINLGHPEAALRAAEVLVDLHRNRQAENRGEIPAAWARARLGDRKTDIAELRRAIAARIDEKTKLTVPFYQGLLAEIEAEEGDFEGALARIDKGLALAHETGEVLHEAFLYSLRGEIHFKQNPGNPTPAEEAFQTAIAIAERQGGRFSGLRAALSLAKLYLSTARQTEAHVVLAPALEGFSLTPEMPQIAEAQALLATLAESEEVKAESLRRQQRLKLQADYGLAVMYSKGYAAEEAKAAFARAAEFAGETDDFSLRFAVAHGQWTSAENRGELRAAHALASAFAREAEETGRILEAGVARRNLAVIAHFAADYAEARMHCERALATCEPERDREERERFGDDTGCVAMCILAMTSWDSGEVDRARELIDMANRRAAELGHVPSMAISLAFRFYLEIRRGDAAAALSTAEALKELSQEHGMRHWRATGEMDAGWARGRLNDPVAGAAELRRGLAASAEQGAGQVFLVYVEALAELEAETLGAEAALGRIDEALALARQSEIRAGLPFGHLGRGDILLKRDPPDIASAEEAFRTAISIAKEQGARTLGLMAALSLARLYQSRGRPVEAHAVLAPALEGFSPTPELPKIAEAQALLARLGPLLLQGEGGRA
jgi:class 3 adenylate cyclase/tetratricopeptide (TPR) repeat protein